MEPPDTQVITLPSLTLEQAGTLADEAAADSLFADYLRRLADETRRRYRADFALFTQYLASAGILSGDLMHDPDAWHGMTWGLVQGFVEWQLQAGYAIASINARLATIKAFAARATQAGVLSAEAYGRITLVKGFRRAEARHLAEQRSVQRLGAKKAKPRFLSPQEVARLKRQPDTPQGRRDAVLITLFLDHGLRCGELAALRVEQFDLIEGTVCFDRPKVDLTDQIHRLTPETWRALLRYVQADQPQGKLLWGSRKGGQLTGGMSTRAITKRVNALGKKHLGIPNVSAHDTRHTWTKRAVRAKTDLRALMDAGGWRSPAMPILYAESGKIANSGVQLETVELEEDLPHRARCAEQQERCFHRTGSPAKHLEPGRSNEGERRLYRIYKVGLPTRRAGNGDDLRAAERQEEAHRFFRALRAGHVDNQQVASALHPTARQGRLPGRFSMSSPKAHQ